MKKYWIITLLVAVVLLIGATTIEKSEVTEPKTEILEAEIKNRIEQYKLIRDEKQLIYDILKLKYEKENLELKMLAERRELQFKIATYESKINIRVAKPIPNEPVDPNE